MDTVRNNVTCEPSGLDNIVSLHCLLRLNRYWTCLQKLHTCQSYTKDEHRHQRHHCNTILLLRLHPPSAEWLPGCVPRPLPTQQTACLTVYHCKNVDSVFLSPIKVNSSSISASFTSGSMGHSARFPHAPLSTRQPSDGELSVVAQSCAGSCHPHTSRSLVCADFSDSLAVLLQACTCDDSTCSDTVANLHLFCLLYFAVSFCGNVDISSSAYFSPPF
jgi:hypothetical protein